MDGQIFVALLEPVLNDVFDMDYDREYWLRVVPRSLPTLSHETMVGVIKKAQAAAAVRQ